MPSSISLLSFFFPCGASGNESNNPCQHGQTLQGFESLPVLHRVMSNPLPPFHVHNHKLYAELVNIYLSIHRQHKHPWSPKSYHDLHNGNVDSGGLHRPNHGKSHRQRCRRWLHSSETFMANSRLCSALASSVYGAGGDVAGKRDFPVSFNVLCSTSNLL